MTDTKLVSLLPTWHLYTFVILIRLVNIVPYMLTLDRDISCLLKYNFFQHDGLEDVVLYYVLSAVHLHDIKQTA